MLSALDVLVSAPTAVSWLGAGVGTRTFKLLYDTSWTAFGQAYEPLAPSCRCVMPQGARRLGGVFAQAAAAYSAALSGAFSSFSAAARSAAMRAAPLPSKVVKPGVAHLAPPRGIVHQGFDTAPDVARFDMRRHAQRNSHARGLKGAGRASMILGQTQIDRWHAEGRQLIGGDAKGAERQIGRGIFGGEIVGAFHRLVIAFQRHDAGARPWRRLSCRCR